MPEGPKRTDLIRAMVLDSPVDGAADGASSIGRFPIPGMGGLATFEGSTDGFTAPSGTIGVDTSDPIDGDGSLSADGGAASAVNTDVAGPSTGDKYCGSVRTPPSGGQSELWYGVQDSNNLYFVGVDSVNDEVTAGYYSGGGKTVNDTVLVPVAAGTVYDIELTWRTDGYQEATIEERSDSQITP